MPFQATPRGILPKREHLDLMPETETVLGDIDDVINQVSALAVRAAATLQSDTDASVKVVEQNER